MQKEELRQFKKMVAQIESYESYSYDYDIYSTDGIGGLADDEILNPAEEGFMLGYLNA